MFAKQYRTLLDISKMKGWSEEKKRGAIEILNQISPEMQELVLNKMINEYISEE